MTYYIIHEIVSWTVPRQRVSEQADQRLDGLADVVQQPARALVSMDKPEGRGTLGYGSIIIIFYNAYGTNLSTLSFKNFTICCI